MSNYDFTPLSRTLVGFDRLATMIDTASRLDGTQGYPPYNIEKTGEDSFSIDLAVAGFGEDDLQIETRENQLTITGKIAANEDGEGRNFLHRGIAERSFIRRFQLADHVVVTSADLKNGLLQVKLVRELPEAMKPRTISIGASSGSRANVIEGERKVA